jgi:chromosome segregation ATPase
MQSPGRLILSAVFICCTQEKSSFETEKTQAQNALSTIREEISECQTAIHEGEQKVEQKKKALEIAQTNTAEQNNDQQRLQEEVAQTEAEILTVVEKTSEVDESIQVVQQANDQTKSAAVDDTEQVNKFGL